MVGKKKEKAHIQKKKQKQNIQKELVYIVARNLST